MNPGIDLKIALLFRGQAQLDAAISADESVFGEAAAIFDHELQQPFDRGPPANFTSILWHKLLRAL